MPQGEQDYVYGDVFPHEVLMDQFGGVDFAKGCLCWPGGGVAHAASRHGAEPDHQGIGRCAFAILQHRHTCRWQNCRNDGLVTWEGRPCHGAARPGRQGNGAG
ncbi:MAG: hypothetical protein R3D29_01040 [Nitratireductor sp.]